MLKLYAFLFFLAVYFEGINSTQIELLLDSPHAITTRATFRGEIFQSRENRDYYGFLGIRYAKTPLRFRPPEPLDDEDDNTDELSVQDATKFGNRCPQKFWATQELLGDEDCLFLNVFVPAGKKMENLPVMFYIHGGRFTDGEGDTYGPEYFMDENVVLVTINYRLGVLGFLTTSDSEVPGNMGLRDQALALKWVHENIRQFGGDPSRVTIFGESAGAASVHLQMFWPENKGLFSGAIAQSGTATCGWAVQPSHEAKDHGTRLGSHVGCERDGRSSKEFIECLQSKDWKELILTQSKLSRWLTDRTIPFGPVIETLDQQNTPFLGDTPEKLIEGGKYIDVPFIIGINEDEGHQIQSAFVLKNPALTAELNDNWNKIAPNTFLFGNWFKDPKYSDSVNEKVRKFYFSKLPVSPDTRVILTNLYSDVVFGYGTTQTARMMSSSKIYLYVLAYKGEFSCTSLMGIKEYLGVTHADDLQYFFYTKKYGPKEGLKKNSKSEKISKRLVKLWVSFAETGRPEKTWGKAGPWLPVEKSIGKHSVKNWYILDKKTSIQDNLFEERIKFWDGLADELFLKREYETQFRQKEKERTEL